MIDDSKLEFNESEILILNEHNVLALIDYCTVDGKRDKNKIKEIEALVIQLLLQLCLRLRDNQRTSIDYLGFTSDNRQWTRKRVILESLFILANGRIKIGLDGEHSDQVNARLVL